MQTNSKLPKTRALLLKGRKHYLGWGKMLLSSIFSFNHDVLKRLLEGVVNPFPHKKILDQTKLKASADDMLYVTKMIISVFDRVEIIVGKGEIACTIYKQFLLFPQCFQKASFLRPVKRCHSVGMG